MNGWKDRILGAAMVIVIAAVAMLGVETAGPDRTDFTFDKKMELLEDFPRGRFIPDPDRALYFQVCLDESRHQATPRSRAASWHRFWPNGLRGDTGTWCWW